MNRAFPIFLAMFLLAGCQQQRRETIPAWTAPVVDQADVITPAEEGLLNRFIKSFQAQMGTQLAVLTVQTLGGADPSQYATEVGEKWGVGNKEKSTGVLVLIVPGDRAYFTAVGRGAEAVLPDSLVGSLQRDILVPAFKAGEYGVGLRQYVHELAVRLAKEEGKDSGGYAALLGVKGAQAPASGGKQGRKRKRKGSYGWIVWLIIMGLFAFGGLGRRRGMGGFLLLGGLGGSHNHRSGGGFGGGVGGGFGGGFGGGGAGGSW